jgi:3-methyladenine DNA glycosylase AlkD
MAAAATRSRPDDLAARLAGRLLDQGTPERAAGSKAYLKSDLVFLGADTATLRRELRTLLTGQPDLDRQGVLALAEAFWRHGPFELRAAAAELLTRRVDLLRRADLGLVERLLRDAGTWALVDALAPQVAGPILDRDPPEHPARVALLDRWAADSDFWIRRAALLVHLVPLRRGGGDFATFARHADALLGEREFFVRKAIGWVLRDTAKKRPGLVSRWLLPRAARASGVTVREAVKHLPEVDRSAVLAAHRGERGNRRRRNP